MRWAIFSDVHANLPALEAVWKSLQRQSPDMIFCLGDLVNQHVWNNEVVEFIRGHHIATVKGNHDQGIGEGKTDFPFSYSSPDVYKWGKQAITYTLSQIRAEHQAYLRQLPMHMYFSFTDHVRSIHCMLAHGSATSIEQYLFENLPQEELIAALDAAHADVLIVGHTHRPYHKIFYQGNQVKHLINVGSAGRPKDGNWRPVYVVVDWNINSSSNNNNDYLSVQFYRVEYDLEKSIKAIQASPLSLYFASCLMQGE
ncbi:MAG: metallophosphoesterase family protein [Thermoflavifilum aggregans]|nr:metallophosphoesterase family protein [Thermoflavifilum aggregans]